ncbi:hypothetical protein ACOMHN_060835 [Nucella lapillus]
MKVVTPEISWHGREPIFSVDLQQCSGNYQRMATAGVDRVVRMWRVRVEGEDKVDIDFLANLNRHTATVNVCRFSPDGNLLATAGDDSVILLWKLSETPATVNIFIDEDEDNKEIWVVHKTLRGHLGDVYDVCWSSDSRYIVSGSVDNSAIAWDIHKDQKVAMFSDHKNYVLGVAWDPLREYIATLSSDRSCRIFNLATKHCLHNISKMVSPHAAATTPAGSKPKASRIFHDDTLQTFFRRLTFSPDGQLLITPAGLMETAEKQVSATFVFTRGSFKEPAVYLPSPNKATLAVRVCPCLFELRKIPRENTSEPVSDNAKEWEKYSTLFCLPYRVVFAVATEDAVVLYDSQQTMPFAYIANIHYHTLSDLSWSKDGRLLVVASTDGYCSVVTFEEGELGVFYTPHTAPSSSTLHSKTAESQLAVGDKAVPKKQLTSTSNTKPSSSSSSSSPTPSSDKKSTVGKRTPAAAKTSDPSQTATAENVLVASVEKVTLSKSDPDDQDKTQTDRDAKTKEEGQQNTASSPTAAAASAAGKKGDTATTPQSGSKQPKRIQFTTLSLNKK